MSIENLPRQISVSAGNSGSHLQGIAIDKERKHLYYSFTTCLIKTDLTGKIVGSVKGLTGHMGCIAYNPQDNKIYGSLEYKKDIIGRDILHNLGNTNEFEEGFYIVCFDLDKITRLDMDAEKDGIMKSVFLQEVYQDYTAEGHHYGCSGIDGITVAPDLGKTDGEQYLYVAYGVYADVNRQDNDHQVILKYKLSDYASYAQPLDQFNMHRNGPEKPDGKYFVQTGNTDWGIQNLEYDALTDCFLAAVYPGRKEEYTNYSMFFINHAEKAEEKPLKGMDETGATLSLTDLGSSKADSPLCGSFFPHGSTGVANLGDGYFYIAEGIYNEQGNGGIVKLYQMDRENLTFQRVE